MEPMIVTDEVPEGAIDPTGIPNPNVNHTKRERDDEDGPAAKKPKAAAVSMEVAMRQIERLDTLLKGDNLESDKRVQAEYEKTFYELKRDVLVAKEKANNSSEADLDAARADLRLAEKAWKDHVKQADANRETARNQTLLESTEADKAAAKAAAQAEREAAKAEKQAAAEAAKAEKQAEKEAAKAEKQAEKQAEKEAARAAAKAEKQAAAAKETKMDAEFITSELERLTKVLEQPDLDDSTRQQAAYEFQLYALQKALLEKQAASNVSTLTPEEKNNAVAAFQGAEQELQNYILQNPDAEQARTNRLNQLRKEQDDLKAKRDKYVNIFKALDQKIPQKQWPLTLMDDVVKYFEGQQEEFAEFAKQFKNNAKVDPKNASVTYTYEEEEVVATPAPLRENNPQLYRLIEEMKEERNLALALNADLSEDSMSQLLNNERVILYFYLKPHISDQDELFRRLLQTKPKVEINAWTQIINDNDIKDPNSLISQIGVNIASPRQWAELKKDPVVKQNIVTQLRTAYANGTLKKNREDPYSSEEGSISWYRDGTYVSNQLKAAFERNTAPESKDDFLLKFRALTELQICNQRLAPLLKQSSDKAPSSDSKGPIKGVVLDVQDGDDLDSVIKRSLNERYPSTPEVESKDWNFLVELPQRPPSSTRGDLQDAPQWFVSNDPKTFLVGYSCYLAYLAGVLPRPYQEGDELPFDFAKSSYVMFKRHLDIDEKIYSRDSLILADVEKRMSKTLARVRVAKAVFEMTHTGLLDVLNQASKLKKETVVAATKQRDSALNLVSGTLKDIQDRVQMRGLTQTIADIRSTIDTLKQTMTDLKTKIDVAYEKEKNGTIDKGQRVMEINTWRPQLLANQSRVKKLDAMLLLLENSETQFESSATAALLASRSSAILKSLRDGLRKEKDGLDKGLFDKLGKRPPAEEDDEGAGTRGAQTNRKNRLSPLALKRLTGFFLTQSEIDTTQTPQEQSEDEEIQEAATAGKLARKKKLPTSSATIVLHEVVVSFLREHLAVVENNWRELHNNTAAEAQMALLYTKPSDAFGSDHAKAADMLTSTCVKLLEYLITIKHVKMAELKARRQSIDQGDVDSARRSNEVSATLKHLNDEYENVFGKYDFFEQATLLKQLELGRSGTQFVAPQPLFAPILVTAPPRVGKSMSALLIATIAIRLGYVVFNSVSPAKKTPIAEQYAKLQKLGWFRDWPPSKKPDIKQTLFLHVCTCNDTTVRNFEDRIRPNKTKPELRPQLFDILYYSSDVLSDVQQVGYMLSELRQRNVPVLHLRDEAQSLSKEFGNPSARNHSRFLADDLPPKQEATYLQRFFGNSYGLNVLVTATQTPVLSQRGLHGFVGSLRDRNDAGIPLDSTANDMLTNQGAAQLLPFVTKTLAPEISEGYVGVEYVHVAEDDEGNDLFLKNVSGIVARDAIDAGDDDASSVSDSDGYNTDGFAGMRLVPTATEPDEDEEMEDVGDDDDVKDRDFVAEGGEGGEGVEGASRRLTRRQAAEERARLEAEEADQGKYDDAPAEIAGMDVKEKAAFDAAAQNAIDKLATTLGVELTDKSEEETEQTKAAEIDNVNNVVKHFLQWYKSKFVLVGSQYTLVPTYIGALNRRVRGLGMVRWARWLAREAHNVAVENKETYKGSDADARFKEDHTVAFIVYSTVISSVDEAQRSGIRLLTNKLDLEANVRPTRSRKLKSSVLSEEWDEATDGKKLARYPENEAMECLVLLYVPGGTTNDVKKPFTKKEPENERLDDFPGFRVFQAQNTQKAIENGVKNYGCSRFAILGYSKLQAGLTVQTTMSDNKAAGLVKNRLTGREKVKMPIHFCVDSVALAVETTAPLDTVLQIVGRSFADLKAPRPFTSDWQIKLLMSEGAVERLKAYSLIEEGLRNIHTDDKRMCEHLDVTRGTVISDEAVARLARGDAKNGLGFVGTARDSLQQLLGLSKRRLEKVVARGMTAMAMQASNRPPSAASSGVESME